MSGTSEVHATEEMKIVVNSLYLSLAFLLGRIEKASGKEAAIDARNALINGLTYGDIDMAIMEDRKTFDFVLAVAEALPEPQ